ncbi:DUF2897 family protein [Shewanella sp. AS1]|uniref:DUF2897 family protein n=1 Tax=Shewanella sp. AS1 TaxID=2907626 RepID=UPI001F332366|nr:DUF2897 family protein [Shewanella sp. AS1]MCE9678776.1 DUF2897 family protein [Shewanella sp. AS1]
MSNLEVWLIIILVIGVIASNIAVLKYSAKFKLPQFGKDGKPKQAQGSQKAANEQASKASAAQQEDKTAETKQDNS